MAGDTGGRLSCRRLRQVKNPYVDRYLRAQRERLYPGGLFGRGRAAGQDETQKTARLIMDYVRQGGRLGFISISMTPTESRCRSSAIPPRACRLPP